MSIVPEPPAVEIDLTSQAFKQDPFPTLARMRELGPVIRVRIPLFGKVWMATTYDAVNDLLRDHHRFVQNPAAAGNRWMGAILRWLPRSLKPLATNMLLRDPPDHRRLRSLVDQAFQRQSVEALRPRLEALADEALDRLAARGGPLARRRRSAGPFRPPVPAGGHLRDARPAAGGPAEVHALGLALLHGDQLPGDLLGPRYRRAASCCSTSATSSAASPCSRAAG